jgi:hypothetical protein
MMTHAKQIANDVAKTGLKEMEGEKDVAVQRIFS